MNEIMENMNELKDKLFAAIDTICKDYEAKKPEFKAGQWVIALIGDCEYLIRYKDDNGHISSTIFIVLGSNDYSIGGWFDKIERPATPQEIESHLRKICDEKYIGKKVKSLNSQENRDVVKFNEYCFADDTMFYYDLESGYLASVYCKGKWAEIIPDKKKLPCTKDEAIKLIQEYALYYRTNIGGNVFDFVNEYESQS